MANLLKNINPLPVLTWSWLKINQISLAVEENGLKKYLKPVDGLLPDCVALDYQFAVAAEDKIPASMRQNYDFVATHYNSAVCLTIPEGIAPDTPVVLDYVLEENNSFLVDYIYIKAQKNSNATIIIRYRDGGAPNALHCGFTFLDAAENAKIKLIKVQQLPETAAHIDAVAVQCMDLAEADVLLAELGGHRCAGSCDIALRGSGSRGNLGEIYMGQKQKEMDFNYRIEFGAKATEGSIDVNGVLTGEAKKTLKSTIDFMRGASGSKGSEAEKVLNLSDKVVNISAPLLLCGEDDVEGRHATTTGQPDPGKLYYLMSRGFSRKSAVRLLVEASFTPLLNKIEELQVKAEIIKYIGEIVHGE